MKKFLAAIACIAVVLTITTKQLLAHNLDTRATSMSFAKDYVQTMSTRAGLSQPLVQMGDEFWVVIKTTPGPGTDTGVGGYQTFYVPNGLQVVDAAYVLPSSTDPRGFISIPMKGQSPIATGSGPVGASAATGLTGFTYPIPNILGINEAPVTAGGVSRGTIAGVYADTGIFFSTDARTVFNSYGAAVSGGTPPMSNNSGDTVGEWDAANIAGTDVLGVMTLWDSYQLRAFGRKDVAPIIDTSDGRGNAPWGMASAVAGPQSGYRWAFNAAAYTNTASIPGAIETGPWNRIKYPGSQISKDQAGLIGSALGYAGVDGSSIGYDFGVSGALPTNVNAVRFAVGQLELGRSEYSAVKVKVNNLPSSANLSMYGDAFGGDAGGTNTGKDHLWRYFDPTVVTLQPATLLQKVAKDPLIAQNAETSFQITFANLGNVSLPNVVITDILPSGLSYLGATPVPNTVSGSTMTWHIGSVAAGQIKSFTVFVRGTSTGVHLNTVIATSNGTELSRAYDTIEVNNRSVIRKDKTVTPSTVAPGGTVTYTINVYNDGTAGNGVPMVVTDILPPGFTYNSFVSATVNGASITPTIDAANTARPKFTVSQSIQPGKTLVIKFVAITSNTIAAGTYFNETELLYEGKILSPIPEAPVTVGGARIGDFIWRDWDADSVQDSGEEGIAGITVRLYAADGTTLLQTTATDSTGMYLFTGLTAATYVVKVTPPVNYIQTYDPDVTVDHETTTTLTSNQNFLTADFGYQPTGAGVIGDQVFEDLNNNGVWNAGEPGIANVTVNLYEDTNGNSSIDAGDLLIATQITDGSGVYNFTGLNTTLNYLVAVDTADSDIPDYFTALYGSSARLLTSVNPRPVAAGFSTIDIADFGFWRAVPGTIGDQVFIDADGNGVYNSLIDSPLSGVTVTLLLNGSPFATTTTALDGTYLFGNLVAGNYTVSVDANSPSIPAGYAPAISQIPVTLTVGQNVLTADFPFSPLIAKAVDKAYAVEGDTLNFGVNVNYTGDSLLSGVTVRDFLPTGTSFTAAQQGGQLVNFTSTPGVPGEVTFGTPVPRIYAFQGGTAAFWRYNATTNAWNSSLASAPGATTTGSALTNDGSRYVYAFQGGSRAFYRYDAITGIWSDVAVADLPGAASVQGLGASLVYLEGLIYAFPGNTTSEFWRYSVAANTWTQITSAPATIGAGGGLATDGSDIYALRGGGTQTNWRYDVVAGTWSAALDNVGQNIGAGSGFVYANDGLFYATTGAGQNRIYRYDSDADAWTQGTNGGTPNTGGDLVYDGTNFYMSLGNNTSTFVQRFYGSADVSRAAAPGLVNAGGGLTFLESPEGIRTTSISVSPSVIAVGSPVAVTMTVESSDAVTNVIPSALTITGISATIGAATPASIPNLAANTPTTFTWTVTPTSSGVATFIASASGTGGVVFNSAISNSLLASPDGATQFVEWNLGGNTPGEPATTSPTNYLYGLRGNNSTAFWAYQLPQTAPGTWNSTLDPVDATGFAINAGARMVGDQNRYIYALQGGGLRTFLRYDTVLATWSDAAVADLPLTSAVVNVGGAVVYLNGFVYAWPGGASNQFWRYNVATGLWDQRANTLNTVLTGASLTTDGTFIYGTRGGSTQTFWRYNPSSNIWETRPNTSRNVNVGGSLAYAKGFVYLLTGNERRTYRYNVSANTWARVAGAVRDAPATIGAGGSLSYDGNDSLYALRGGNQTGFYIFNLTTQSWSPAATLAVTPDTVGAGGALIFQPTGIVSQTTAVASRSLVGGISQVTVRMTINSDNPVNNITASAPSYTSTSGVTATFSSATLISPDNNISGTGDSVIYEWIATVTPGSAIGSITFTTNSSVGGAAKTRSVIVTPQLTYSALVGANPPSVIRNTALVNEAGLTITNVPSNTTETATSGSIGDYVWGDLDLDGVQDVGEFGLSGITVNIYAANGVTLLGTDVTDANGHYRYFGLAAGNYVVGYDLSSAPPGYLATTAISIPVTLTTGQQFNNADFGLAPLPTGTGSIGDFVWFDSDNDTTQDLDEPGIANVTVTLERFINSQWVEIASAITTGEGAFLFSGLSAANYRVRVDPDSQIVSPYALGNFELGAVTTPTYDFDGINTPNEALVTLATDSTVLDTLDFGYNWSNSIGDFVWWDLNKNGSYEPGLGETPIENARVQLYYDADNNGILDFNDPEIAREFTDASGFYTFANLPPGLYFVDVYEDSITTNGIRNIVPTTGNIVMVNLVGNQQYLLADFGYFEGAIVEGIVFHDDNRNEFRELTETLLPNITVTLIGTDDFDNPVNVSTTTNAEGLFTFLVTPGDYTITYNTTQTTAAGYPGATTPVSLLIRADAGEDNAGFYLFGVDNSGAVGDLVFGDANGNGVQDSGEAGLANVTVNLYSDSNYTQLIDVQATDSTGSFLFTGLADGTYYVQVDTATLPLDYNLTPTADPDPTKDSKGTAVVAGGSSVLTMDFGYQYIPPTYLVSGTIYDDNGAGGATASDGTQSGTEPGIANVTVQAFVDTNNDTVTDAILSTTSDALGFYSFAGILQNSNVRILVNTSTLPSTGYGQTGDPDVTKDNQTTITNLIADVADQDFGYREVLADLSGTVVLLADGNGLADVGETAVEGVTVSLRYAGPDGIPGNGDDVIQNTTTDVNGDYSFSGLLPGYYQISKTNPIGYHGQADRDGGNPDVIEMTIAPGNALTGIGDNKVDQDFELTTASFGDYVWMDMNGNGVQDVTEPPLSGVRVYVDSILNGTYNLGEPTAITDTNGYYTITGLAPGTYTVRVASLPAGASATYDVDGILTPNAASVTLAANEERTDVDWGYQGNSSIGDYLWYDVDGDGVQDVGEPPLVAVTVFLDTDNDGTMDANEPRVITDGSGNYTFDGLVASNYHVRVDPSTLPGGLSPSYDKDGIGSVNIATVTLLSATNLTDVDFGYEGNSTITGHLYIDSNGDGNQDVGEPNIANVDVVITDSLGGVQTVITDSNGDWTASVVEGLASADINEGDPQYPTGYSQSEGTDPTNVLAVENASTPTDNDGFFLPATISGFVRIDEDGDTVGDVPHTPVTVQLLDENDVVVFTTVTGIDGSYTFTEVPSGDFTIVQTVPNGFEAVDDLDGGDFTTIGDITPITVAAGDELVDQNFVNSQFSSIAGNVFNDDNRLTDSIVNGIGTNAGGIYINLVNPVGNLVIASIPVGVGGAYLFGSGDGVEMNTNYLLILTPAEETVGNVLTVSTLPLPWLSVGENLGAGAGNDGIVDGKLAVSTTVGALTQANFGIVQVPDVTPIITAIPNVMTGPTLFNAIVRVNELNSVNTEGLITVKIPKDIRWTRSEAYNPALTSLNAIPLENSKWAYSEDLTHHIFQTTDVIPSGQFSTFGFRCSWNSGQTTGIFTMTSQIESFSGQENRNDNNADAEKIDYFIN